MWIEAIITQEDLVKVMERFLPVKVLLDEDDAKGGAQKDDKAKNEPDRSLLLHRPTTVTLVPDEGVRITCPAELTWSIVGMSPSVTIDELSVMILPRVVELEKGSALEFRLEVKEADFHSFPAFIDDTIVKAVNRSLAKKKPTWNFTKTLTRTASLAGLFDPVEALRIEVSWGKTKLGAEVLGLVVSFEVGFDRADSSVAAPGPTADPPPA